MSTALSLNTRISGVLDHYSQSIPTQVPLHSLHVQLTNKGSPPQPRHSDSPIGKDYFTLVISLHDPGQAGTVFDSMKDEKWMSVSVSVGDGVLFLGRVEHFGDAAPKGQAALYAVFMKDDLVDEND